MRLINLLFVLILISISSISFGQSHTLDPIASKLSIYGTSSVHDWEVIASKLSIHGTSTIHDWEIIAEKIVGTVEIEITTDQIFKIISMQIEIPVINLKSGKGQMDRKTYNALKIESNPLIKYRLIKVRDIKNNGDNSRTLLVDGVLEIAGVRQQISMSVIALRTNQYLNFQGEVNIDMSAYSVDPPTALMGTIKTGKEVVVKFNVNFLISKTIKS